MKNFGSLHFSPGIALLFTPFTVTDAQKSQEQRFRTRSLGFVTQRTRENTWRQYQVNSNGIAVNFDFHAGYT